MGVAVENRFGLSANALKWIAIIAMTCDHFAYLFVPVVTPAGQFLHAFGRLTAPIMSFFIAEGYYHTGNLKNYFVRLGLFALLSHLPFTFFASGGRFEPLHSTGVIYTLFLGLGALTVAQHKRMHVLLKLLVLSGIFLLSLWGDWRYYIVLWVLIFGLVRENKALRMLLFGAVAVMSAIEPIIGQPLWVAQYYLYGFAALLAIPLLLLYNGTRGKGKSKYFFYIYYPAHTLALTVLYLNLS